MGKSQIPKLKMMETNGEGLNLQCKVTLVVQKCTMGSFFSILLFLWVFCIPVYCASMTDEMLKCIRVVFLEAPLFGWVEENSVLT